ncbi:MAG: S1C family serine protease [Cellulomonas sp.]
MTISPEGTTPDDQQIPASAGADQVGPTPGNQPTEQISTEQISTEQNSTEQPTAQLPAVEAPQPTQPLLTHQQPPQQLPSQPMQQQPYAPPQPPIAPAQPVGWGHPAPVRPTPALNATAPNLATDPSADPFSLLNAYPPAGPTGQQEPTGTRTSTQTGSRRLWISVVGAAAAAALIASLGTAGLMAGVLGDNNNATTSSSSLATIGKARTDTAPVSGSTSDNPNWEKVSAAVAPSVVAIQVTTANGGAEGSGVIIDAAGHVLTNNHVVNGADSVQVTLSDGRLYKATIVGADSTTDLAVVQITDPPSDLAPAAMGDSGAVAVGEAVMAVGNPLGLANTVTTGIISALDRPVSASAESGTSVVVTNAIQIDAAINPGNSGGPLFDAQGRVIGITSSIATLSGGSGSQSGSIGLGFAIPINLAQNIAGQLVKSGTAEHAFLGVSLTDGNATASGTTRKGAVIQQVTSGSPADAAKLQVNDVVVAIDGSPVAGAESLTAYVRERAAGDTTKLTIVRDGKVLDVTVTLAAKAATVDQSSNSQQGGSGLGGSGQSGQNPLDPFNRG